MKLYLSTAYNWGRGHTWERVRWYADPSPDPGLAAETHCDAGRVVKARA